MACTSASPPAKTPSVVLYNDSDLQHCFVHVGSEKPAIESAYGAALTSTHSPNAFFAIDTSRSDALQRLRPEQDSALPDGALQPGGRVNLLAHENLGLLLNYFAIGIFNGVLPALVYPLFKIYLNQEGYQSNATSSLLNFAWYLKFPLGFLSDSVPIRGYRRKPYIYLGWSLLVVVMVALACMPTIEPYQRNGVVVNADAAAHSPSYVIPLMLASIGYLLADVACDGLMVEYAHRECASTRGGALTMVYGTRFCAELCGTLVVALGLNSRDYGGSFAFALPLRFLFAGLAGVGVLAVVTTRCHIREQRVVIETMRSRLRGVGRIIRHRATWQITLYGFLQFFTLAFDVSPSNTILFVWLQTPPLTKSLFYCVNSAIYACATFAMRNYLLHLNWRHLVLVSTVCGVLVGLPTALVTVFDVFRDKYFYLAMEQVVAFFDALAMMVRLLVIVEIAEPGFESSTYALVTTVYNLAIPVMTTVSNVIGTALSVYDDDLARDTSSVRWHVASSFFVMYGLRLVGSLVALPLLPQQKDHARELKLHGSSNALTGALIFTAFAGVFLASLTSNLLSIVESTACLRFAGGDGC
ncbi:hypothetical protein P43SY_007411 [Pythium insidiosum]|uniref:Transmembrane protein n=1 Tax=Pythium insidiosum TaxID=114742 RepID=A0AAD5LHN8_PYTIN|nr:hypothetical protein P43SY_007411 [Pythium insidiosum]